MEFHSLVTNQKNIPIMYTQLINLKTKLNNLIISINSDILNGLDVDEDTKIKKNLYIDYLSNINEIETYFIYKDNTIYIKLAVEYYGNINTILLGSVNTNNIIDDEIDDEIDDYFSGHTGGHTGGYTGGHTGGYTGGHTGSEINFNYICSNIEDGRYNNSTIYLELELLEHILNQYNNILNSLSTMATVYDIAI